ncbi:RNA polymerase sigma factor SigJ [Paenibacillus sp. sgz500958]|uniref:RNA polymerase sigma factor SigJ n=1 Tax=Paenibacillus sp. sgz500958 TaxID=3242475 RepID=UPI0036D266D4
MNVEELYANYKGLLFRLAYQLTGSAADAEDVVQDVFLKAHDIPPERMSEPKAYLCKMVTNRCRDLHKSARKKREQYFGEWLPAPILTTHDESFEKVARDELMSYAMLVLLERLSPSERAVFVLREALGFEYAELALLLDKSEVNCRKLVSRAKGKMGLRDSEAVRPEAADEVWIMRLLGALEQGQVDIVVSILSEDAVLISDGGGKAFAAVRPIVSGNFVARFLLGITGKRPLAQSVVRVEMKELNGQSGLILHEVDGTVTAVLLHVEEGLIQNVYLLRNPDKLSHLL